MFLDHSTGDYYQFDKYDLEWKPKGNFGVHYFKALEVKQQQMKTGLDLVQKTHIYRARTKTQAYLELTKQKRSDMICFVDQHSHSHYLFDDIQPEFVVDVNNLWDPHPVQTAALNVTKENYAIMAETERGPVIALHQNTCCVQFCLDKKYRETIKIFTNFLE